MTETAIRVNDLSKLYRIGEAQEKYRTLRDTIANAATAPFRGIKSTLNKSANKSVPRNTIWALKDISFEIKQGDVVGVIGRNGAGKSTLLKILSRITEPTKGMASIHGRVASLLEIGTGFHHELTGRENVHLNGAILGMRKADINRRFDEIVEFAEVAKFIDTPVKHYSSGMYLRLAFAVAAHLETDILLVDEVLAVGDAAFQRKCLGKMENVAADGRTVLFVSHNLSTVKELCQTSLVLQGGALEYQGPVVEGLARYSRNLMDEPDTELTGTGWGHITINNQPNVSAYSIRSGDPFTVEAQIELEDELMEGQFFCIVSDPAGTLVLHQRVDSTRFSPTGLGAGRYRIEVRMPPLWLTPTLYTLYFKFLGSSVSGKQERHLSERVLLDVTGQTQGLGRAALAPPIDWSIAPIDQSQPNTGGK
jgi:lipopolysaccharide transport system ATP-binding protein